ncbi:MAG: PEGA domain-containing protein [Pseudomonadota bacterium]
MRTSANLKLGVASILFLVATTSCSSNSAASLTRIETVPDQALVQIDGFGECDAPCTIEHNGPRRVTIAKAGYEKVELTIAPGQRVVRVELDLAAPTGVVEADGLPPLE